ncbi:3-deoxy-7-phosphoheptulonate synthase [Sporomusaceae bacterium BoRhaA]|uniref:3-deoxy-7-phosphoheptulonate synthase n=1 Tax=Pelorhabdus rhamnosifermentans TaxID=2772457 RepID=UPI001C05EFE2|nr:3-deoxy-7-phosphoheptulonate synthase [Pelorhabdus rhamnosifermentans]MBU2702976.1 3-deoxy-7-phosphoheptulonate synthase [Pelorhabdus rhamnosifermentans]
MLVVMKPGTVAEEIEKMHKKLGTLKMDVTLVVGEQQSVFALGGDTSKLDLESLQANIQVEKIVRIQQPYKLASRTFHPEDTIVDVRGCKIGGGHIAVIAGPCSVESEEQMIHTAELVKQYGATLLRGGAYKPRSSPYSFQGLGVDGLKMLVKAREATGLPIVTEAMSIETFDAIEESADLIQIGARNMQNFPLLKRAGKSAKPILLKRGLSATLEEFLMSAEYILAGGNANVILCERGIRTFDTYTRNTLDISLIPAVKELSHLPIIVDPSHACGKWSLVEPLAKAAIAVGADGLIIEVHHNPEQALCDGAQSLKPEKFGHLMSSVQKIIAAV